MEVKHSVSSVDRELLCVCLWWAAADETDRTLDIAQSLRWTETEEESTVGSFILVRGHGKPIVLQFS